MAPEEMLIPQRCRNHRPLPVTSIDHYFGTPLPDVLELTTCHLPGSSFHSASTCPRCHGKPLCFALVEQLHFWQPHSEYWILFSMFVGEPVATTDTLLIWVSSLRDITPEGSNQAHPLLNHANMGILLDQVMAKTHQIFRFLWHLRRLAGSAAATGTFFGSHTCTTSGCHKARFHNKHTLKLVGRWLHQADPIEGGLPGMQHADISGPNVTNQ